MLCSSKIKFPLRQILALSSHSCYGYCCHGKILDIQYRCVSRLTTLFVINKYFHTDYPIWLCFSKKYTWIKVSWMSFQKIERDDEFFISQPLVLVSLILEILRSVCLSVTFCADRYLRVASSPNEKGGAKGPLTPSVSVNSATIPVMTLAILFSLKTMESPQNGVATYFQVTPLISMRTESLASS